MPQILSAVCCCRQVRYFFFENTFWLTERARDSAFSTLRIINSEILVLRCPNIKYANNARSATMAFAFYFFPRTLPGPSSRCSVFKYNPFRTPDTPKRLLTSRFDAGIKTPSLNLQARGRLISETLGLQIVKRSAVRGADS